MKFSKDLRAKTPGINYSGIILAEHIFAIVKND
jgi:hypothetical protein